MQSMTFLSTSYHDDDSICIGQIVTWEFRSMRITCWNASNIPNFQCVYSPSLIAFKSENEADFYIQHTIGWLLTSYLWAKSSETEFRLTFQSRVGNNAEIQGSSLKNAHFDDRIRAVFCCSRISIGIRKMSMLISWNHHRVLPNFVFVTRMTGDLNAWRYLLDLLYFL